ncbi:ABC transporter permease [Neobacillus vireti]|uniref:ABC transporter, permease protein n=1 Tax=Neobacillus vireti LMG 21834 TaxID=1131730 RepID=A0AB94IFP8_9BACI|nr:ABC transporter permease [Neobacillus vireti]ETI65936.1 ABC transporter, permease protein [Neobacillus vireti LMG 21834]KLT18298.1 ABC transporter permease [Neobacillus vireti]
MRMTALIKRICQQMLRDKRTLALMFVAPLLILTLMYFLFNGNTVDPKLGVLKIDSGLVDAFKKADIKVKQYEAVTKDTVVDDDLDGLLQQDNGKLKLTLRNDDPSKAKVLQMKVNQVVAAEFQFKMMMKSSGPAPTITSKSIDVNYVYGNADTVFFDVLSPILVGFFVFFFVFIISGIGLLRERTTGTLERLLSTPIRRVEIVTAYLVGYGIFAVIQTMIVVFYAINVLDIVLVGSIWNVLLINLLLALVALSLGILLSTFAASEFQMIQFIPIAVIPQVFFAGIFPLEGMANWLQAVAKIIPMYYAGDALKGVMYKGESFSEISGNLIALVIFAAIFIVLNILALKKYRKL